MATAAAPETIHDELAPEPLDEGLNPACDGQNDGRTVTLEQYLNTSYSPDCDFIDGRLEERNLGEIEHARLQRTLLLLLAAKMTEWQIEPLQELRLQVKPNRFRIPDIMVVPAGMPIHRWVREAPLLCIEILSPADRFSRLHEKVRDYLTLGVQDIWAFDPETAEAYRCDANGFHKVLEPELTLAGTAVRLQLADIFPQNPAPASGAVAPAISQP